MKKIKFTIIILLLSFVLASCEGPKKFSVTIVDKQTQQPLDSVFVDVKVMDGKNEKSSYNIQGYTDSNGKFIKEEMIGYGVSMRRWDFYMEYDKKGYVSKKELNHTEGLVELEH
ncbi:MAG: hypothetical protein ABR968_08120 [Bacteroidales bacterium]|jgi:hypothetical protein